MPGPVPQSSEDISDWLQEVAKRPWVNGPHSVNPSPIPEGGLEIDRESRLRRRLQRRRDLVGLAVLTISYLQYFYFDVMVQIASIPKVIVFVPLVAG
jgi:hypothetical protein